MNKDQEFIKTYSFDKPLFFASLCILAFGIVMVFSSSGVLSTEKYGHPAHFLIHQAIGAALGLAVIIFILKIKTPFYQYPVFIFGLMILTYFSLALALTMPAFTGTNRWIYFGNFSFQPSELAKISIVLFLAYVIDRNKERLDRIKTLIIPAAVIFSIVGLILIEPDYSTAALILATAAVLLLVGGIKLRFFIIPGLGAGALFLATLLSAEYRMGRIFAFLSPEKDPLGKGFHIIQSKMAVGSGGIFSLNIGESVQKLFFLPCAHTDYIYSIIGEEFGLIGTLGVLVLFTIIFWRGLVISWKAPTLFTQVTAAGLTLAIYFQALLNISIVLGMAPPTGLPLPLMSFGRSSMICTLISLGILLHISQRRTNRRAKA